MSSPTVITIDGREFTLRPLTYDEVRRIRREGDALPYEAPAAWVFTDAVLAPLPYPAVRQLAQGIYDLTFGTPAQEKN